jgi:hypothetical protein
MRVDGRWFQTHHETEQPCQDGGHRPGWVPSVRVEVTDGETQSGVDLESAIGCDHDNAGRLKGVVLWELKLPMIVAT